MRKFPDGIGIAKILSAALQSIDPYRVVREVLENRGDQRNFSSFTPLFEQAARIFLLGIGKASISMADGVCDILGSRLTEGLVVTKYKGELDRTCYTLLEGDHPIPDERSIIAGIAIRSFLAGLNTDDLLVCLISGGGSALVADPISPITLKDYQAVTAIMLSSGCTIDEMNIIRRHIDSLKGGGLARAAYPAQVVTLIISDVVSGRLESIASGPTAPDPTTKADALKVIHRHRLEGKIPASILQVLRVDGETPKEGDPLFTKVHNIVIADNSRCTLAAQKKGEEEGYESKVLSLDMQGEAKVSAIKYSQILCSDSAQKSAVAKPRCLIIGGECTVRLNEKPGAGGRNTEFALAAVSELADCRNVMMITLATDGEDGRTDAAGAVVTGETYLRARNLGLDPGVFLRRHDSYSFFSALDDLLRIGSTGTNVNDLVFLFSL